MNTGIQQIGSQDETQSGIEKKTIVKNNKMKIALIAHDGKKADMVAFVMKRLKFFKRKDVELVGTGTTGTMIEHAGLKV